MAIDESHNVYLTYFSGDYVTCKLFANGDVAWVKRYAEPFGSGQGYNQPTAIMVDDDGGVYVTGYSSGTFTDFDFATVKYSPCTSSSPKAGDASMDDSVSISDIIHTLNYIFGRGPILYRDPPCDSNLYDCWVYNRYCRYDWNGDKKITLGDCIRALNFLFQRPGEWAPVPSLGCCPFPMQ
jgi:hypothetical protein